MWRRLEAIWPQVAAETGLKPWELYELTLTQAKVLMDYMQRLVEARTQAAGRR